MLQDIRMKANNHTLKRMLQKHLPEGEYTDKTLQNY